MFIFSRWLRVFRTRLSRPISLRNAKRIRRLRRTVLNLERLEERETPAAIPNVLLGVPPTGFIGSTEPFSVTFSNTGTIGYAPFAEVLLPTLGANGNNGISYLAGSATYLGAPVASTLLTFDAAGHASNPYAHDAAGNPLVVNGIAGNQVVFFQLPFGSFAPGQPGADQLQREG